MQAITASAQVRPARAAGSPARTHGPAIVCASGRGGQHRAAAPRSVKLAQGMAPLAAAAMAIFPPAAHATTEVMGYPIDQFIGPAAVLLVWIIPQVCAMVPRSPTVARSLLQPLPILRVEDIVRDSHSYPSPPRYTLT